MKPWLRHAVSHQVQVLRLAVHTRVTTNMAFISSHLKRLQLCHMYFEGCSLDFSSCQVLEELELTSCYIHTNILSQSIWHLNIPGRGFDMRTPTCISAPNLIGLRLAPCWGLTPFLDSMPSLVTASVMLEEGICFCLDPSCVRCNGQIGKSDCSVVFKRFSGATNLELAISDPAMFIFRNDLKWCPMFCKLKTLLLNDWCVSYDFRGLIYFLQHSPILETLTLQFDSLTFERFVSLRVALVPRGKGRNSIEQSLIS
nr:uncharacterized protein LOC120965972 [Aegilops tauschii subsp. strangulata]